jgi:hypothetical protein
MENADNWNDASPWNPVNDKVLLKHLGKAAEEVNELGSALARCMIQGVDGAHPVTGKTNRSWLLDEDADVLVTMRMLRKLIEVTDAEYDASAERQQRKTAHLEQWHRYAEPEPIAYQYEIACSYAVVSKEYSDWETRVSLVKDFPNGPPTGPGIRNVRALR